MKSLMENWVNAGKALEEILRPPTYPLAVSLVRDESEFPEKTRRPDEKLALCQALTIVRKWGWTMGITERDSACPVVNIACGWTKILDEFGVEQFLLAAGYVENEAGAKRILEGLDRLDPGKVNGVVISPLTRAKIIPNVILVYGNPAQIMRLIQGATYREGKRVKSELVGVMASCSGILQTYKKGEYHVIIPGTGDRVFAATQDNEMLFAIPAAKVEEIIAGMRKQIFVKYPVPSRLPMPPPFPGLTFG